MSEPNPDFKARDLYDRLEHLARQNAQLSREVEDLTALVRSSRLADQYRYKEGKPIARYDKIYRRSPKKAPKKK